MIKKSFMPPARIKNPDLVAQIDEGLLEWQRQISPITEHYARLIAQRDYRGKRLAYWGHLTGQNLILMMTALKQTGAEIILGACNVDSTDDIAAAYVVSKGISVYGWRGMSQSEYQENLAIVRYRGWLAGQVRRDCSVIDSARNVGDGALE